jgi:hypothetical protein
MKQLIGIVFLLLSCEVKSQIISQPSAYTLDQRDLFIITEYKETEYQVFTDHDSLNLPANLSTVNYYVDINDQTDSSNMMDINYLYLQGYHEAKRTNGQLFYLITQKTIPVGNRKTNFRSSRSVDQYSQLTSIEDMTFGYWQLDTITHRIFLVFRESTKIYNMDNFRIFAGLVANKNIYITKSMDSKDTYLFDYNFKRNKELFVKLPLNLENVLYSEPVLTKDTIQMKTATYSLQESQKNRRMLDNNPKQEVMDYLKNDAVIQENTNAFNRWDSVKKEKRTYLIRDEKKNTNTVNAAIKFSYFPSNRTSLKNRKVEYMDYDTLSFTCLKKKRGKASKYVLLKGSKDGILTYWEVRMKRYRKYYSTDNQQEFIFINVVDPYDEKIFHTFRIPYSSKGALPGLINFFKKKIFNA